MRASSCGIYLFEARRSARRASVKLKGMEAVVKGEDSDGFGLGLAIVRRLLETHGSRLELQHADGCTLARIGHPAHAATPS